MSLNRVFLSPTGRPYCCISSSDALHYSRPVMGTGSRSGLNSQVFMDPGLWQVGAAQQMFHCLCIPKFVCTSSFLAVSPFLYYANILYRGYCPLLCSDARCRRANDGHSFLKSYNLGNTQRCTPIACYTTAPLYNIIIIFDTAVMQRRIFKHEK